jgi:MOSC domain-containing protein YiiM
MMGKIVSIVHTPAGIDPRPPDRYARVPLAVATLEAGRGIVDDRKGKQRDRQLNVMALETLAQLGAAGFRTAPGEMGEQIVVSSIGIDALPAGTLLRLGEAAVIEVLEPRTGCARFRRIQGRDLAETVGRLGIMAQVVTGGTIRVGDTARIVEDLSLNAQGARDSGPSLTPSDS